MLEKRTEKRFANRREFIGGVSMAAVGAVMPGIVGCATEGGSVAKAKAPIRAALMHLGTNMWSDFQEPGHPIDSKMKYTHKMLRTEDDVWMRVTALMQARHYNMAVIDVGEGVVFPSHPELALKDSWSAEKMRKEVRRLRSMGIEAVPKLNFSTCHDGWLGTYAHMVSSPTYYRVIKELINDTCDIFENPRFFHLGMDEESANMQKKYPLMVVRHGDLLWHDIDYMFDAVEQRGARPIVFCGTLAVKENIEKRIRKTAVMNMGIYGSGYDLKRLTDASLPARERNPLGYKQWFNDAIAAKLRRVDALAASGYDILSCSSNWIWNLGPDGKERPHGSGKNYAQDPKSCDWLHRYLAAHVPAEHFIGEMAAPWQMLQKHNLYCWESCLNQLADAMEGKPVGNY